MSITERKYVVFFDLDRTITGINSGYAMARMARQKGLLGITDILSAFRILVLHKLHLGNAEKFITGMGTWLKGHEREEISVLASTAVSEYLVDSVYREFTTEFDYHQSLNAGTVILSSSLAEICHPLAAYLGFDKVLATEMECIGGIYTGNPSGAYCYGEGKKERIVSFCLENNIDLSKAYYYADSSSDLPVLEIVGNPVCVNPDKNLKVRAKAMGWRICYWHQYNKKLINDTRKSQI